MSSGGKRPTAEYRRELRTGVQAHVEISRRTNRALFTTDVLTCNSRSTGGINNINDGFIPFRRDSFRLLILYIPGSLGHLMELSHR